MGSNTKSFSLISPFAVLAAIQIGCVSLDAQAASGVMRDGLLEGASLQLSRIEDVVSQVKPGGVLVISEEHGNATHYTRQKEALQALHASGRCTVSVGLEFIDWTHAEATSGFLAGTLAESDFLKAVGWGGNPFADYRDQALFPRVSGGSLLGVNAPRSLSGAIAKKGVAGLSSDEASLLPPTFEVGSAEYRERFDAIMGGGHVPAAAMDRYFAAQSVWDDTMAWQAREFLDQNPSNCLAIIVGDFHAAWGGGLPDRLRARGVANVVTISQFDTGPLSDSEVQEQTGPHPKYGSRADALWLSSTPVEPARDKAPTP